MLTAVPLLLVAFALILAAAELFTNGVEWIGLRLGLGHGAVGSILAAFGTAMPETTIPLIAILFVGSADSDDVGVGAILGAPFLLSTAAMAVAGAGILFYRTRRRTGTEMRFDATAIVRDLSVFFCAYMAGIASSLLPMHWMKIVVGVALLIVYGAYARHTIINSGEAGDEEEMADLKLHGLFGGHGAPPNILCWTQVVGALALMIGGAYLFVTEIDRVSTALSLPPLVLALIVAPLATELPETFNSVLWVKESKDTLAMGNISGAMVFQSCIPVSIGIIFTDWKLTQTAFVSAAIAIVSTALIFMWVRSRGFVEAKVLARGAIFWVGFVIYVVVKISV